MASARKVEEFLFPMAWVINTKEFNESLADDNKPILY